MKRRDFMKSTLAASAITVLSNAKSARSVVANDRIQMALIGCGSRSDWVSRDFLARPQDDVRFAYCCDVDITRAENRAKGLIRDDITPRTIQDANIIFDDKSVDGVVLVTPDHWHALHTIQACQAGKDVYCEKPLCRTPFEGEMMIKAAQKYGRIVGAGNQTRSSNYCLTAKKFIEDGNLGKIEFVRIHNMWREGLPTVKTGVPVPETLDWDRWIGPSPYRDYSPTYMEALTWGNFWDFGNGLLATQGVHQIDVARWILGLNFPKTCYSVGGLDRERLLTQPPETQSTVYEFDNLIMNIEHVMNCPYMLETDWEVRENKIHPYWFQNSTRVEIYGDKFLMVISRLGAGWQVFDRTKDRKPVVKAEDFGCYTQLHKDHMSNFIDAMRQRKAPASPVEECYKSTMLIIYANIALRSGSGKLEIDPVTGHITNCPETQKLWRPEFRKEYDIPEIA